MVEGMGSFWFFFPGSQCTDGEVPSRRGHAQFASASAAAAAASAPGCLPSRPGAGEPGGAREEGYLPEFPL